MAMIMSRPPQSECLYTLQRALRKERYATRSHIERHNSLLSWETDALLEIDSALRFCVSGQRCAPCRANIDACFAEWHRRALRQTLPLEPVYMLLCDGAYLKTIDQAFKRRNGWSRTAVLEALQIWPSFYRQPAASLAVVPRWPVADSPQLKAIQSYEGA